MTAMIRRLLLRAAALSERRHVQNLAALALGWALIYAGCWWGELQSAGNFVHNVESFDGSRFGFAMMGSIVVLAFVRQTEAEA